MFSPEVIAAIISAIVATVALVAPVVVWLFRKVLEAELRAVDIKNRFITINQDLSTVRKEINDFLAATKADLLAAIAELRMQEQINNDKINKKYSHRCSMLAYRLESLERDLIGYSQKPKKEEEGDTFDEDTFN